MAQSPSAAMNLSLAAIALIMEHEPARRSDAEAVYEERRRTQ
jgi:hypothetical protein